MTGPINRDLSCEHCGSENFVDAFGDIGVYECLDCGGIFEDDFFDFLDTMKYGKYSFADEDEEDY